MLSQLTTTLLDSFRGLPRAIWLLSLVSLINRTGAMVIAFLTLYLTQSLHFDIRDAGYIMSFFGVGSIFGSYLGGYLTDKLGYYRVQWLSLVLTGCMLLVVMLIRDFWLLCLTMFSLSLISEAFQPANSVAIRMHSDESNRTRSFSLMRVAVNLAITVALAVGGLLVALGWHWLFWVDSLTCFGAAAILLVYFKDKKAPQNIVKDVIAEQPFTEPTPIQSVGVVKVQSAYRDGLYLLFFFLTFAGAVVFMQIVWTVPAFFKEKYGWSEAQIGLMSALNGFIVTVVEMPLIFRIEGRKPSMQFVRLGIFFYGLAYAAFFLPLSYSLMSGVLYMIIISLGEIFVMPFSTSWAAARAGEVRQGQYMALYTMAYSLSNIFAPMLGTQVIAAFGFDVLWYILVILSIGVWIGFWMLEKKDAPA